MATISCTTKFNLVTSPKTFVFTDTTDWAGQSISTANVNGCFRIIAPSGSIVYNNADFSNANCDIWINNDLTNQTTIPLPLTSTGVVEPGVYQIRYSVYNSSTLATYTQDYTFTFDYTAVTVCIENSVDCITPRFTSTDATIYVVNGITPTLIRSHKLYFPPGNVDAATFLSSAASTIMTGTFYQGSQTTTISSSVLYEFSDGLFVQDVVSGSLATQVDCTFICDIYCCIKNYWTQMNNQKGINNTKYLEMNQTFDLIMANAALAKLAIECGKPNDVNTYISCIQTLSNCQSSCSCSGDTPSRVTGLGGITVSTVVEGSSPVVVTSSTTGSVTTYTVSLTDAFIAAVNSFYNTVVAAGTNISSVTDSGIVAGTRTFTVNAATQAGVLYNTTTGVSTTSGSMTILQSYTLAADQLSTNGSYVELIAEFDSDGTTQAKSYDVRIGGTVCHTKVIEFRQTMSQKASRLIVRATRQSATTLFLQFWQSNSNGYYQTLGDGRLFYETGFSVSDLSVNTTSLQIRGRNIDAVPTENINCAQFIVTYFKL